MKIWKFQKLVLNVGETDNILVANASYAVALEFYGSDSVVVMAKSCFECKHLSENWAAGTGEFFCSHPGFALDPEVKLDPVEDAKKCDFYEDEEELVERVDFGSCCFCGKVDATVRSIVCVDKKAPVPGTGWGCVVCGLPSDGAVAVVCDECVETGLDLKEVVHGYATTKKRHPYLLLTEDFQHKDIPH